MRQNRNNLSDAERKKLESINKRRIRKGDPRISSYDFKYILKTFTNKNGKFSGSSFRAYTQAYSMFGIQLFKKKIKCRVCNQRKSFRQFRYLNEKEGFFDTCKSCNPAQYSTFYHVKRRRKKKLIKNSKNISYRRYLMEKAKYKDSANRYHPRFKQAIQKMVKVFGRKVLKDEKKCKDCYNYKTLYKFPANFKARYIGIRCRRCDSVRISQYIKGRIIKKKNNLRKK
ncbi:hypothetical protein LEP1GSC185_3954 [Leptospira licerasiae serovar Varillal str. VAR 010]|uniref:Uncharacterized protein n=1 Tax=Leptospira licerasiae str. MMD4847 TaxID=1049971 RepID=A0ABP2RFY6_9LEPT|nr:hypothetical protein LEP1GSC185_3954 [Leptospira licerasiae serovar Varillal str. VAR 010]EJZ42333.1 hypothetical protein LEP1GSC178_0022 [Leptospira licerasiae str. MMD4847]